MTSAPASPAKICIGCKADVTYAPRMKDPQGRYYCQSCASKAPKAATPAKPATNVVAAVAASGDDFMSKIINEAASKGSSTCPSCQHPISADAKICTGCGFNLESGKKAHTRVERAIKEKSVKSAGGSNNAALQFFLYEEMGIATLIGVPYLIALGLVFVNPSFLLLLIAVQLIAALTIGIWIIIDAFKQSVVHGVLCIILPFIYWLIYVAFLTENPRLKAAYGTLFLLGVLVSILRFSFPDQFKFAP